MASEVRQRERVEKRVMTEYKGERVRRTELFVSVFGKIWRAQVGSIAIRTSHVRRCVSFVLMRLSLSQLQRI